jgi:hypothetical protein
MISCLLCGRPLVVAIGERSRELVELDPDPVQEAFGIRDESAEELEVYPVRVFHRHLCLGAPSPRST